MECVSKGLLTPYPVLHEKAEELVAQVRFRSRLRLGGGGGCWGGGSVAKDCLSSLPTHQPEPHLKTPHSNAHPTPQIKGTVLLMPNGSDRVTSAPEQPVECSKAVEDEELVKLLATGEGGD